eukprot:GHVR01165176.1.p2 GENE.GHVR01165176.1~~GHVR01165176.1.p2  ORF type:complete len:104 (+),score=12.03 GHVR01165176.1:635-946(+)
MVTIRALKKMSDQVLTIEGFSISNAFLVASDYCGGTLTNGVKAYKITAASLCRLFEYHRLYYDAAKPNGKKTKKDLESKPSLDEKERMRHYRSLQTSPIHSNT